MPEPTKMLHANADKTALVPEDHPDARYVVNPNDPGEFRELVEAHKAQAPVEDKSAKGSEEKATEGFEPNPPGSPEREKHEAAKRGK